MRERDWKGSREGSGGGGRRGGGVQRKRDLTQFMAFLCAEDSVGQRWKGGGREERKNERRG